MKNNNFLMKIAWIAFYSMALVVIWNTVAPEDLRILTETGRKIWAMAGLSLYALIMLEKHRQKKEE